LPKGKGSRSVCCLTEGWLGEASLKKAEPLLQAIRRTLRFKFLRYELRQETYLKLARRDEGKMKKIEAMLR
jgi:hypothetical protein